HRMTRLLQGDVGSGKTVVALHAMLSVSENAMQSALMVPTELVARQHFETIKTMTSFLRKQESSTYNNKIPDQVRDDDFVVLLTGSVKGKARSEALEKISSGKAHIIIGTHALFQEHVEFKQLALIIIDEQHRFGVNQRMALSSK